MNAPNAPVNCRRPPEMNGGPYSLFIGYRTRCPLGSRGDGRGRRLFTIAVALFVWLAPRPILISASAMAPRLPDANQTAMLRLVRRGISRFPPNELPHMPGSRRAVRALALTRLSVLPSAFATASAPGYESLRGSMAGLCAPLPTLRCRPYGQPRTAQGRCGSLLRHRVGLAPTTRCRSPGALRKMLDK